jgi:diguanylate cyclase (GGDEF)-like protein
MTGAVPIRIASDALSQVMPMHLILALDGRISGLGPTLGKLAGESVLIGQDFFDVFDLRRPGGISDIASLIRRAGERLHLTLRNRPDTGLRGIAVPLHDGAGLLVNLSFGIGVVDAVRNHALTGDDFAPTDLTVEMLYLVEAKFAVMKELREMNLRLQGAKVVAEEQALTDTLTGLRNRRALDAVLGMLSRQVVPFGLMHLDLDFFKTVNDTLGHAAGDHVLVEVARVLTDETRAGDTVARVGGDEFVLILHQVADPSRLMHVAQRIIDRLARPIPYQGQPCRIAASLGVTLSTVYAHIDPEQMLKDADAALYVAKRMGRGRAVLHDPA